MKIISKYLSIVILVFFSAAYTVVYAEDYKIGVVNALRLMEQSPQAEKMRSQIQKEFAPRDRELVVAQKKLKASEDKLTKDAAIMSESERKKLERNIITQRRELKRSQDEFREDFSFRRNELLANIQKEIIEAIQTVARQNNYDLVMSEGVIWASNKVDMTPLVVEYLKKKNGSAGGKQ